MWTLHLKAELPPNPMRNNRKAVKVRSCQGFVLRHISRPEADAMEAAPELGFVRLDDGSLQKLNYQTAREESPSVITPADMRMNVGESGEPKPMHLRREGYIDPVEAARDKIRVWPAIVQEETSELFLNMCPWPRNQAYSFAP
jgi:hypothetical protein